MSWRVAEYRVVVVVVVVVAGAKALLSTRQLQHQFQAPLGCAAAPVGMVAER